MDKTGGRVAFPTSRPHSIRGKYYGTAVMSYAVRFEMKKTSVLIHSGTVRGEKKGGGG